MGTWTLLPVLVSLHAEAELLLWTGLSKLNFRMTTKTGQWIFPYLPSHPSEDPRSGKVLVTMRRVVAGLLVII